MTHSYEHQIVEAMRDQIASSQADLLKMVELVERESALVDAFRGSDEEPPEETTVEKVIS